MDRRLVVEYPGEGQPPKVEFEGMWSRMDVERLNTSLLRALRIYKLEMAKRLTLEKSEEEEKKDGRRRRSS